MGLKEMLKPEAKKIILPVVLVLMFLYVVYTSYSMVSVWDRSACDVSDAYKGLDAAVKANDTGKAGDYNKTITGIFNRTFQEMSKVNTVAVREFALLLSGLNPLTPLPCELTLSPICSTYISRKSYNCIIGAYDSAIQNKTMLGSLPAYSDPLLPVTYSSVIFFVEGYLISSILLWYNRSVREKSKRSRERL